VKRVLVTGMSGTGKSSVVRELAARGFKAVDTDDGWSEPLRRVADHEIRTTMPLNEVVMAILRLFDA